MNMSDTNDIREHPFYTFDELIEKLEKKNLIIIDKPNLIYYFKSFNYQRVINEYNKPFLIIGLTENICLMQILK